MTNPEDILRRLKRKTYEEAKAIHTELSMKYKWQLKSDDDKIHRGATKALWNEVYAKTGWTKNELLDAWMHELHKLEKEMDEIHGITRDGQTTHTK